MGMDRNHSRYWLFENSTPGLYVEKGTESCSHDVLVKAGTACNCTNGVMHAQFLGKLWCSSTLKRLSGGTVQ